jgi:hypothetical protein
LCGHRRPVAPQQRQQRKVIVRGKQPLELDGTLIAAGLIRHQNGLDGIKARSALRPIADIDGKLLKKARPIGKPAPAQCSA